MEYIKIKVNINKEAIFDFILFIINYSYSIDINYHIKFK
jgi:hypothetical protein